MIITCVEHPDLAEDGGHDVVVLVAHFPDQALGRAPQGDHQVSHGQVDQVVIHRGPACREDRKDKPLQKYFLEKVVGVFIKGQPKNSIESHLENLITLTPIDKKWQVAREQFSFNRVESRYKTCLSS